MKIPRKFKQMIYYVTLLQKVIVSCVMFDVLCNELFAVTYEDLDNLSFSSYSSAALENSGDLTIKNINDGTSGTIDVLFYNNYSTAPSYGDACGGGICAGKQVDIEYNGELSFVSNRAITGYSLDQVYGGAIYAGSGVNLSYNNLVIFDGNYSAGGLGCTSRGGGIFSSKLTLIDNNSITLQNNYAESAGSTASQWFTRSAGGAMFASSTLLVQGTKSNLYIKENYVVGTEGNSTYGGALYSSGEISLIDNNSINISGNYSKSSGGWGYGFNGNSSCGGALYAGGSCNIKNNVSIEISNNYTSASSTSREYSRGGAVYAGNVVITGNSKVTFEKNYEVLESAYRLRSIYSLGETILSAPDMCFVEFYDSVYSGGIVSINSDYLDKDDISHKATGDIIFSGKYTVAHLKEVKGKAGTASEIANSRTSELLNTVNLYGGTLRVEDKAVLKTHAINVVAGSNATMKVSDATVDATGYDIKVNDSAVLVIGGTNGSSTLIANNINIGEGATLSLTRTQVTTENVAMTLAAVDSMSVYNDQIAGVVRGNLSLAAGATLIADGAHLSMDGGILNFLATTENKTNLVLTLGAEYGSDSQIILFSDVDTAKFLQDNITATSNSSIVTLKASDYFAGEWVNDKTELVYDDGTIYVTGVNIVVPEPTTATLSLLALVGLAARRRRK